MSIRSIMLKYLGWCPRLDSASKFKPSRFSFTPYLSNLGAFPPLVFVVMGTFMFLPLLFYSVRAIISGESTIELIGVLGLISIGAMLSSVALGYRWLKQFRSIAFDLRSLTMIGATIYALYNIWASAYIFPYWTSMLLRPRRPLDLEVVLQVAHFILIAASGFIILKIVGAMILSSTQEDNTTRLTAYALGALSLTALLWNTSFIPRLLENKMYDSLAIFLVNDLAYIMLGAFAIDLHGTGRPSDGMVSAVVYSWLTASVFEYGLLTLTKLTTVSWLLRQVLRPITLLKILNLPSPGFVAVLLIAMGVVLNKYTRPEASTMKNIYTVALLAWAVTCLSVIQYIPRSFQNFLRITSGLIQGTGPLVSGGLLPGNVVWGHFYSLLQGIIILAMGILARHEIVDMTTGGGHESQ
jgi:hypothetical protein